MPKGPKDQSRPPRATSEEDKIDAEILRLRHADREADHSFNEEIQDNIMKVDKTIELTERKAVGGGRGGVGIGSDQGVGVGVRGSVSVGVGVGVGVGGWAYMCACGRMHSHIIHTRACARAQPRTQTRTHARTYTCTYTYIQAKWLHLRGHRPIRKYPAKRPIKALLSYRYGKVLVG